MNRLWSWLLMLLLFAELLAAKAAPEAGLNRLRAWGKEWHPQSEMLHFGIRYYTPSLGRWTTEDPLGELGGINLFQFVGNDPVNQVDPFGLDVYSYPSGQGPSWGLIGPAPYVYGESRFERYVQVPFINTVSTAVYLPAAAVGFVDWASEGLGLTRLMGISPSDAAVAVAPMFPAAGASSRCAAKTATGAADDAAKWIWGQNKGIAKSIRQMDQRGWNPQQVTEAIKGGQQFPAQNLVNQGNPAIRYVHPQTGQSVVQDTVTKEIIHFGGLGFKY